ncbi:MAG: ATP-dependent helicase HepA [Firmicutes bacterium ADurb.Bin506]|nr:MAG: ATP-dependent helicase HepA [Firmicutes bacterium ADurb.Bin506]
MILHAAWLQERVEIFDDIRPADQGKLLIWAESARRLGYRARGRQADTPSHPFQASADQLLAALAPCLRQRPTKGRAVMFLPTADGYPVPSPAIIERARRVLAPTKLKRWTEPGAEVAEAAVTGDTAAVAGASDDDAVAAGPATSRGIGRFMVSGLLITPADAVRLLAVLPERPTAGWFGTAPQADTASPESLAAAAGDDLLFWAKASKLVLELIARHRFVPDIAMREERSTPHIASVWLPVLSSPDCAVRVASLARSMPWACRAAAAPPDDAGLELSPARSVLGSFIGAALNDTIKDALDVKLEDLATSGRELNHGMMPPFLDSWSSLMVEGMIFPACAWAAGLATRRMPFSNYSTNIARARTAVRSWLSAIGPTSGGFRTCFRLEPPPDGAGHWTLHFMLQAVDDPSVLVPAAQVWEESSSLLNFLDRRFENPQERLLTDLGRATRLFPALRRSLTGARPESCSLDTAGAYAFLREAAPLFEEAGLGVITPPWWDSARSARRRLGVRVSIQSSEVSRLSLNSIVEYDWQVALGDEVMTHEELRRLAELKVPLVQMRGEWVEINPTDIESAIRFWKKRPRSEALTVREVLQMELAGPEGDSGAFAEGLPVVGIDLDARLGALLSQLTSNDRDRAAAAVRLPTPQGFVGELRDYQVRGVSWLWFMQNCGFGACLADDMGLGKTVQMIALLLHAREHGFLTAPALLVCPTSVVGNWQRELKRFAPDLRAYVHHGSARLGGDAFAEQAASADVVITTYSIVPRDVKALGLVEWGVLVLDEAQNIKNPGTKQSQSIRSLRADFRVALTGTPVENRLAELWSIMDFLNRGYLGSAEDFRRRYAIPIERYHNSKAADRLRRLTQPFIMRRVKTDPLIIQDLPEKQENKVFASLTREQVTLYEAVVKDTLRAIEEAEGIQRKGIVLAALLKLKQVCNHPAQFLRDKSSLPGRSGKLTRLAEMLEEAVTQGDRCLVFTQFAEMGALLQAHLAEVLGCEVAFLHGGVPRAAREDMIQRFQNGAAGPPVFVLSLKAGGTGLNLTRASYVFHFDRWWNPAVENQATDRAFRIGQTKNVQVYKFVCAGTVEERIDQLIEEKRALADQIVGIGENWLTELSNHELRDLFTLRNEDVADGDEV